MSQEEIGGFFFDLESANQRIDEMGANKILLQLPDGLIRHTDEFSREIKGDISIWGGTCYGACDLPSDIGGNEVLIHVGHAEIPNLKNDYPVVYIEGRNGGLEEIPDELSEKVSGKVALYSTVQYLDNLGEIKGYLDERGYETVVGKGNGRVKYPGHVLGCNFSCKVDDADTHLFIGTGMFHPIGLSVVLDKELTIFNPMNGEIKNTKDLKEGMLRKRHARISKAQEAGNFGIIVSSKKGQSRRKLAEEIKSSCERCMFVETDEITPGRMDYLGFDCFINTACPRIALDDDVRFKTTVITPEEFEILIKKREWKDWGLDQID
ncbi:MAG: diphthamide biosynthesis enzyme Dph2 [Thermoplasmata archaeon]